MGLTRYVLEDRSNKPGSKTDSDTDSGRIDLKPLYVSHAKYENDWPSLFHTHPFSELFYVIGGRGSFLTEEATHPIMAGDFIIINANTSHTEKSSPDMPLEYISVAVKDIYFTFDGYDEYTVFNCQEEQKDLKFYMTAILQELMDKNHNYATVCQNLLEILVIQLMRWTNHSFKIESTTRIHRECMKIKRYIEFNYAQEITLDNLARLSHINKYYMSHVFTKCFGSSPIQYLCQIRIQSSKDLLANTDFSITDVASLSGFSSHSYFAQCFQKDCGMTASAYRRECKKNVTAQSGNRAVTKE